MKVAFLHVEDESNNPVLQRLLAQRMNQSVRKNVPDSWLIQMTDLKTPSLDVDEVIRIEPEGHFMPYRLKHLTRLKGENLILDTDVIVRENPEKVFSVPFDVCLTRRDKQIVSKNIGYTVDDPVMVYNTGVMFSRNPMFWDFALGVCEKLEERHQKWYGDQVSILKAVESRMFDIAELKCDRWNYTPSKDEDLTGRKIVHYKGKRKEWMLDADF